MLSDIEYKNLVRLYEEIFNEKVDNSKEFRIFVEQGNPNPLRVRIEDYIYEIERSIKTNPIYELDGIITDYIENNGT